MGETLTRFEELSSELKRLHERRLAQRRAVLRDTPERRRSDTASPGDEPDPHELGSSNQTP